MEIALWILVGLNVFQLIFSYSQDTYREQEKKRSLSKIKESLLDIRYVCGQLVNLIEDIKQNTSYAYHGINSNNENLGSIERTLEDLNHRLKNNQWFIDNERQEDWGAPSIDEHGREYWQRGIFKFYKSDADDGEKTE